MNQYGYALPMADGFTETETGKQDAESLRKFIGILKDNRKLIASVTAAFMVAGAGYAFVASPVYEANILLQVEDNGGLKNDLINEPTSTFDIKTASATEMEVLRSRMVVAPAVERTRLYIEVKPDYFPLIGRAVARYYKDLSEPGILGFGGYVWGNEKAEVGQFDVPEALEGSAFVLRADRNGGYTLLHEEENIQARGRAGELLTVSTDKGPISLRVDRLLGNPGAEFKLTRQAKQRTVDNLQDALKITEKGKSTGVINVALEGENRAKIIAVVQEIGREYLQQNEEKKSGHAEKSLAFLNRQLPEMKRELERSEASYNAVRNQKGTVNLNEEAHTLLGQSSTAQVKLAELQQKRVELLSRFNENHPFVETIDQQIRAANADIAKVDSRIRRLPTIEQDVVRLTRDVQVNTQVYTNMLSTAQQLRLVAASRVGNARLLDQPVVPVDPIKPRRALLLVVFTLAGILLGMAAAFARKTIYRRIDDPSELKQLLGVPVSATIPLSRAQKSLQLGMRKQGRSDSVLANHLPTDVAVESLRGFRASLQYAMREARNNIVVITSPAPEVGKSFVAVNFAAVLGSVGKRVLLVDADLRRAHLHRYFGLDRDNGLADLIVSPHQIEMSIHQDVVENVDFLAAGGMPLKPTELLAHENFGALLKLLSARYDFVLIDTAPVLAVADVLTVGPHAGAIYSVVRGGVTTAGEIEEAVKRMTQAGVTMTGTIFNDLRSRAPSYGASMEYAYS